MMSKKQYRAVGVMSGTSLDGLDIVLCDFFCENDKWSFNVLKADTYRYSNEWERKLSSAQDYNASEFIELHRKYGAYIGEKVRAFLEGEASVDLIGSHGHTIFHKPDEDITFQIGCGAYIAANCGLPVISDFRTLDIAYGGQGAPLVPVGDKLLFHDYDACINLGGFANISFQKDNRMIAYDICPINFVLNDLIGKISNESYDKGGETGKKGNVIKPLLDSLNAIPYYVQEGPKSLAREWIEQFFTPVINEYPEEAILDVLHTCYHHMAMQIADIINTNRLQKVLVTGGGAFNDFLIELVSEKIQGKIIIPDKQIIEFKEAIIFAFLGVLRTENTPNCLKTVTGAKKDNVGGSVYLP